MARAIATPALLAISLVAQHAEATEATTPTTPTPTKQACVDAATRGQIQRDDGRLAAAFEAFTECAQASCPQAVRQSCVEWLAGVQAMRPRITVRLADPDDSASLHIDGSPAAFGDPVALDPGGHVVRVEAAGRPPFTEDVALTAGERRTIIVRRPESPRPEPAETIARPTPPAVWALGAVAALGVASWATFGILARSETDRLVAECAPACSIDDRDSAFRMAVIADVSLGVSVLAAAGAAYLFFTRPSRTSALAPAPRGFALGGVF